MNKIYKGNSLPNNKMKKVIVIIISILIINTVLASNTCRSAAGQTIFRCSDVLPNAITTPGTTIEITIYCCLTGTKLDNPNGYDLTVTILDNHTYREQVVGDDDSISIETHVTPYHASDWITNIDAPEKAIANQEFPVKITFKMPLSNDEFYGGAVFKARFDVMVNIPGTMVPNIAILPNIIIPGDWKTGNVIDNIITGFSVFSSDDSTINLLLTISIFIILGIICITIALIFKKEKMHKKMKGQLR